MSMHINNQEAIKKLSECIDYYEVCNRAEGKNSKTISWYSANLRYFRSYLQNRYLPDSIDSIDIKLLREYVNLKMEDVHMDDSRSVPPILFGLVTCIPCSHVILWREGGYKQ